MDDTLKTAMDRALNNLDYGDEFTAADLRAILDSHAALRARLAEVEKERGARIDPDYVQGLVDLAEPMLSDALGAAEGEIDRLTAALATARRDALEEVAQLVDEMQRRRQVVWPKDIRALITQEEPTT